MHDQALIDVVTRLVDRLDQRGIAWCVLRNYETFPRPRSDTSDLDLMVDCKPDEALKILNAEIGVDASVGIGKVIVSRSKDIVSFFLTIPGSPPMHVDFVFGNLWMGCALDASGLLLANRLRANNIPIPVRGHEAANTLIHYLFYRGEVKPEYRQRIQIAAAECKEDFESCLSPVWGKQTSAEMVNHAASGDWDWFSTWQKKAKRDLLLHAWINPLAAVASLISFIGSTLRRMLQPPGLWIAFLGPDGCGKTTVGAAYRSRLNTLFNLEKQRHLHWRPGWLPAPGKLAGKNTAPVDITQPHARPPRGRIVSLARFLYFWIDYVIGHWLKVRPILAKGGLVTFDRYYHDFLVDQRRYRLNLPPWLLRVFAYLVPQPELLFVFAAPASVLHARKQELPPEEIAAQLATLRRLTADNTTARIIDVDRTVDEIVAHMERETFAYLDRRNRRRLGWLSK